MRRQRQADLLVNGASDLGKFRQWKFADFTDIYEIEKAFGDLVDAVVHKAAV